MADLFDLGDKPPLGEIPARMHAYLVRQNRFGQPSDAWKREVIPTPTIGPDEVLIYVMASGINYNNVWAALGQPLDVIAERFKMGEPEDFHAGGSDCQFARAQGHQCIAKPRKLTWEAAGCFLLCASTAYRMLMGWEPHTVEKGDAVLVWGAAGGLGSMALEITRAVGGRPIAVVSDDDKRKFCLDHGAAGVVN